MMRPLFFVTVACSFHCCFSFVPFQNDFAQLLGETHYSISTSALLTVASDLLQAVPNTDDAGSMSRIVQIKDLSAKSLLKAYYGATPQQAVLRFGEAIEAITDANEDTDTNVATKYRAAMHFDSEAFASGQDQLVQNKKLAEVAILNGEYSMARAFVGKLLHGLQDFYSHSNWVEMGMTSPNDALAREGMKIANVARPDQPTCADCSTTTCEDTILEEINARFILTSGYYRDRFQEQWQRDELGNGIVKDEAYSKCSHGGFLDISSAIHATGGINKDSSWAIVSPAGSELHYAAARLAKLASIKVLNEIWAAVGNEQFLKFLNLDPLQKTIAYVIGTTNSMSEELPRIQASISTIRHQLLEYKASLGDGVQLQYILVPFNDPDPGNITKTHNIDLFLNEIAALIASGGGDCPEPSIGALIRALDASQSDSPIYVFTDASAKDEYLLSTAANLIAEKRDTVTFIIQNGCGYRKRSTVPQRQTGSNPYSYLATLSGGQVLNIEAVDLSKLSTLVLQSIEGSPATIFFKSIQWNAVNISSFKFYIDAACNNVIISVTGSNLRVSVKSPSGSETGLFSSTTINTSATFVGSLNTTAAGFQYGTWTIAIRSSGTFTSQVTALTSLDYTYSLHYYANSVSTLPYGRNGLEAIEGDPLQGKPLAIYVQPNAYTDGSAAVLSTIKLLGDISGLQIDSQLLKEAGNGTYIGLLAVPLQPFRIQLIGKDASGKYLSRIGNTIRPSDIEFTLGNDSYPLILSPGERKNCTLLLHNYGSKDTFVISATVDRNAIFTLSTVRNITIDYLETVSFNISVLASGNATDGSSTLVTVTAASLNRTNTVKFVAVFAISSIFHYITKEYPLAAVVGGLLGGGGVLLVLLIFCGNHAHIQILNDKSKSSRRHPF